MGWYGEYFLEKARDRAYDTQQQAMEDILSLVDVLLQYAFAIKNSWDDRLEMRGIVVTPSECEMALNDRRIRREKFSGAEMEKNRQNMREDLLACREHVKSRAKASSDAGREAGIWRIADLFSLNWKEQLFLFLAAAVDFDRKYERLYGYLQDNVTARLPTLGLGEALFSLYGEVGAVPRDSSLWRYLFRVDVKETEQESKLSKPMTLRNEWWEYLNGAPDPYERIKRLETDRLGSQALYVKPVFTWDDLILEESQKELMKQICSQVIYRKKVLDEWGYGKKTPYGNGVSAVFYGAPGTGKTMAAQVIARELGMDLYKVDISRMVSKYIGETEKNIGELFDAAAQTNAVLFFDEADSLFARRSDVSSSNDRYANMETGYLLQKFEEFEGVSILATNYVKNIDDAFKRRIKFMVRFTFPSEDSRIRLWKSMFPPEAEVDEDLAVEFYAKNYELSGSSIKEVVLNAAYLAASRQRPMGNEEVRQALGCHYMKMGKKLMLPEA